MSEYAYRRNPETEDSGRCIAGILIRFQAGEVRCRQCLRKRSSAEPTREKRFKHYALFCWQHGPLATPYTDGTFGGVGT